jgi:serine phosphatase RsbU (regulator of sigma subunit)
MIDGTGARRSGLGRKMAVLSLVVTLLSTGVVALLAYRAETQAGLREVDARLRAIASALPGVATPDAQKRIGAGLMGDAEYRELVQKLSDLSAEAGVHYLYTCIRRGDKILLTTSSATEQEWKEGTYSKPLDAYRLPPPELKKVLEDGHERFATYTDEFGAFRSIFVPVPGNPFYVCGADVQMDDLKRIARENLAFYLGLGLAVALGVGGLGIWLSRRLAAPIRRLTEQVHGFTAQNFTPDAASTEELQTLAEADRTETGELAEAFLIMQTALVDHVEQLKVVTAERERAESQLQIARSIQRGLLPDRAPTVPGFDIAGWCQPADETGGDFFDWMRTKDGSVILVVADATGHGLGPALMAAACRAYARATLVEPGPLAGHFDELNRLMCVDSRDGNFVTFFSARLDEHSGVIQVLSAGHGPALLYRARDASVQQVATHGLPLGVTDSVALEPGTDLSLESGDTLLIVSDGFFEWRNGEAGQFGIERLTAAFMGAAGKPAREIIEALRAALQAFTAGTRQPDDMTAVVIRRS